MLIDPTALARQKVGPVIIGAFVALFAMMTATLL